MEQFKRHVVNAIPLGSSCGDLCGGCDSYDFQSAGRGHEEDPDEQAAYCLWRNAVLTID
jgi:hypothetical protein